VAEIQGTQVAAGILQAAAGYPAETREAAYHVGSQRVAGEMVDQAARGQAAVVSAAAAICLMP